MGSLATGETACLVLSRGDERTWGRLWPWPPAGPVLCSPRVPLVRVRHSKLDRRRDGDPKSRAVSSRRDSSGHSSGHIAARKDNALVRNLFSPGHLSG